MYILHYSKNRFKVKFVSPFDSLKKRTPVFAPEFMFFANFAKTDAFLRGGAKKFLIKILRHM